MSTTRRSSMKRKLMLINTLTSVATLLFASACLTVIAVYAARKAVYLDVQGLAKIYAQLCRDPLRDGDKEALKQILGTISARPHVEFAGIYDEQFRLRPGLVYESPDFKKAGNPRPEIGGRSSKTVRLAIERVDIQPVAYVAVQRDMGDVSGVLWQNAGFILLTVVLSALFALYLSSRYERLISLPILLLARTAERVTRTQDYSLRVKRKTADEIGDLMDCFNDMLARVERRDAELKRLNDELRASQERAMATNQAKSDFLARMSHELRTPLNAIIGYSEMLQDEAADTGVAEFVPDLKRINAAGKHLLMLINDVLDLSKIEAGKMTLFPEIFDIRTMIEDVTCTIQPLIHKNRNTLEVRCDEGLGEMNADLTKVRQALFNILSNSAKFTQEGVITLEARREAVDCPESVMFAAAEGRELIRSVGNGTGGCEQVVLSVTDTGIGMSAEQMDHLFQPFSQADTSTTRKYGGTGLGLTITRRFCEMMGGRITVESELGRGSTFTMCLPVDTPVPAPTEAADETTEAGAQTDLTPCKTPVELRTEPLALVIDDDQAARDLLSRALKREGYQTVSAGDGEAGLAAARECHPDVITLDVLMPRTDGWTVLAALKSDSALSDVPVIMVTVDGNRDLGYALGADEYLTKPIDRERLAHVLRRLRTHPPTDRVLIVDDDLVSRTIARKALEHEGYTVVEAENGRDALDVLEQERPALILLDLLMPVMDGFAFVAALKEREDWRSIPIIVVTARDLTPQDHKRLNGLVRQTLRKGTFSREDLLNEVSQFTTRCAGRAQGPEQPANRTAASAANVQED